MRRIRWGIGGLFLLWVMGIALWAAVALARIARGETTSATTELGEPAESRLDKAARPRSIDRACFEFDFVVCVDLVGRGPRGPGVEGPTPIASSIAEPPLREPSLARLMNPVRGPLVVSLALSSASPASLALIDVAGRRVAEEAIGGLGPGPHRVTLSRRPASGVYWLVLRQDDVTLRRKLVFLP